MALAQRRPDMRKLRGGAATVMQKKGLIDHLANIPQDNRRGLEVVVLCHDCGRRLFVDVSYDGKRFVSKNITFYHDRRGIWCPYCSPDVVSQLPGDPDAPTRCSAEKERAILEALQAGPMTPVELSRATAIKRTTIIRRLDAMEAQGQVQRDGKKYFMINMSQP